MDAGLILQYDPSTDDWRKPRPASQMPTEAWLRHRAGCLCNWTHLRVNCSSGLVVRMLVSRQIVNVGLLDGWRLKEDDWRRTREMRGEGMRTSGSAEWKWLVINRPQKCRCCISSPLSMPDASWLLLLLERPGGWFITSRKQRELLGS